RSWKCVRRPSGTSLESNSRHQPGVFLPRAGRLLLVEARMRRENGKTFARSCVITALIATSLLAVRSYAQDRGSEHIRNVVVNNDFVAHVLAQSDLLAIGWFHSPPDEESGRRTLFRAEEMEVPFTVVTDFTGRVGPNTVVTIRLNSD